MKKMTMIMMRREKEDENGSDNTYRNTFTYTVSLITITLLTVTTGNLQCYRVYSKQLGFDAQPIVNNQYTNYRCNLYCTYMTTTLTLSAEPFSKARLVNILAASLAVSFWSYRSL